MCVHACVYTFMHISVLFGYINLNLGQWCDFPQYPSSIMFTSASEFVTMSAPPLFPLFLES